VIGFSANDPDALVPVGKKAMEAGIKVMSWDSAVATAGRMIHETKPTQNWWSGRGGRCWLR